MIRSTENSPRHHHLLVCWSIQSFFFQFWSVSHYHSQVDKCFFIPLSDYTHLIASSYRIDMSARLDYRSHRFNWFNSCACTHACNPLLIYLCCQFIYSNLTRPLFALVCKLFGSNNSIKEEREVCLCSRRMIFFVRIIINENFNLKKAGNHRFENIFFWSLQFTDEHRLYICAWMKPNTSVTYFNRILSSSVTRRFFKEKNAIDSDSYLSVETRRYLFAKLGFLFALS